MVSEILTYLERDNLELQTVAYTHDDVVLPYSGPLSTIFSWISLPKDCRRQKEEEEGNWKASDSPTLAGKKLQLLLYAFMEDMKGQIAKMMVVMNSLDTMHLSYQPTMVFTELMLLKPSY